MKVGVIDKGVVENENEDPSSLVDKGLAPAVELTVKSELNAVVAESASETVMVHTTASPTLEGFV